MVSAPEVPGVGGRREPPCKLSDRVRSGARVRVGVVVSTAAATTPLKASLDLEAVAPGYRLLGLSLCNNVNGGVGSWPF